MLKVSPKMSKERLKRRKSKNRYDKFSWTFYNKAQNAFLKIAKNKKKIIIFLTLHRITQTWRKNFKIVSKFLKLNDIKEPKKNN